MEFSRKRCTNMCYTFVYRWATGKKRTPRETFCPTHVLPKPDDIFGGLPGVVRCTLVMPTLVSFGADTARYASCCPCGRLAYLRWGLVERGLVLAVWKANTVTAVLLRSPITIKCRATHIRCYSAEFAWGEN